MNELNSIDKCFVNNDADGINEILYLYSADTLFTDTSLSDALEAAADAAAEDQDQSDRRHHQRAGLDEVRDLPDPGLRDVVKEDDCQNTGDTGDRISF